MSEKVFCLLDKPETCSACRFRGSISEFYVGDGLYKKISRCVLAPETIEDPWRDLLWQIKNKEAWCPLKQVPEKFDTETPWLTEWELGFNSCVDEIIEED